MEDRRIQAPPEPGQMPPSKIEVPGAKSGSFSSRLFLKRLTNYYSVSGEQERLEIKDQKGGASWINSPVPTASHTLGILFRDLKEMTWLKPQMKVVRDDLEAFPMESMRLVNVSHLDVAIRVGDGERIFIKPGESHQQRLKEGSNIVIVDAVTASGDYQLIFKNDINMRKGRRVQSFVFKSQGTAAFRPVRFAYQVEIYKNPRTLFKSTGNPAPKPVVQPSNSEES